MAAAKAGHLDTLRVPAAAGACTAVRDRDGMDCLMLAARQVQQFTAGGNAEGVMRGAGSV